MKVAGYTRVSTDKQREEATIETQVERIEQFCQSKNLELIAVYRDDGITGESTLHDERPGGRQLLLDADQRKFQGVVVYKADRFGRTPFVIESAAHQLYKKRGLEIFGVTETIDLNTSMGRTMFTISSAIAAAERDNTLMRSMDATTRYAEQGVWLGGIVPYGYRIQGKKKEARLVTSQDIIPGTSMSEVDVVRLIYKWAADDGCSCQIIADQLQSLGVPTSYTRDERQVICNKRKTRTANLWRAGGVRNLLVQTTYKGVHLWGKRQKPGRPNTLPRPLIERAVPAIVDEATWEKAQQTLTRNRMMSPRTSKREYLLRGKMKCGLCNLTYAGSVSRGPKVDSESINRKHPTYEVKDGFLMRPYYCCTGKSNYRGLYGQTRERCPSRMVNGQLIETAVWSDIEEFLRNPGQVLEEIKGAFVDQEQETKKLKTQLSQIGKRAEQSEMEKEKILLLFRQSIIDQPTLVSQLEDIDRKAKYLQGEKAALESKVYTLAEQKNHCETTQHLLIQLNSVLDHPLCFEQKQRIVNALVDRISVETIFEGKKKSAKVTVFYRFDKPETSSASSTLTVTGEDVRADSCSTAGKPNPKPAPAPHPRSGATSRE